MIELATVLVTLGAILYHTFHIGLLAIFGIALFVGVCVLIWHKGKGLYFAVSIVVFVLIGAVTVWQQDVPVPFGVFGQRTISGSVISVNRQIEKTLVVVKDEMYQVYIQVSYTGPVQFLPGDIVRVKGEVVSPEDFITSTGRIFGYQQFMVSKGIVGLIKQGQVVLVEQGSFSISRLATIARYSFADTYARYISFPVDGVVAGMVVGYQGGLPSSIQDLFRYTGVLHVLVLSGYNITLLAGFLAVLLKRVPFRLRTFITIGVTIMIVLVSGSGVASVRAGVMGSIGLLGALTNNRYNAFRALFICYLLFFFLSPETIFSDPGFQLSFLATLFMIAVLPHVQSWCSFIPQTKYIDLRELLVLACAAPIFMLPYTMYFSGLFPLASVPANILMAVVTPFITIIGIILLCTSWCGPLGLLLGAILSFIGKLILFLLTLFSHLPLWNTPPLAWWGVVSIYGVLLIGVFRKEIMRFWWQCQNSFQPQSSKAVQ